MYSHSAVYGQSSTDTSPDNHERSLDVESTYKDSLYSGQVQGVQEKLCFFTIHCNPSLAYISVRDIQSSQRNASVQSLLLAGNFLYNQ